MKTWSAPGYAAYVIELLDRFTYEEGEAQSLYRLLVDTLQRVSAEEDPFLAVRYYEIRLLDLVGFRPDLVHCASCKEQIQPQDQFFSSMMGGVLCPKCGPNQPGSRPISMMALKFLRHLQRSVYAEASRANPGPSVRAEMESLLNDYLTYVLERGLNTPAFLHMVQKNHE